jgi:hypothetical protein
MIRPSPFLGLVTVLVLALPAMLQGQQDPSASLDVVRLEAEPGQVEVQAGESVPLEVKAYDGAGNDLPVTWSFTYETPEDFRTVEGPGQIGSDGRFVADRPGRLHASWSRPGPLSARHVLDVVEREVVQEFVVEGQGSGQP